MTHQYPATLPPEAVEDIKRAVAAHQHALVEAYVLVEKYKVQRDEMSERLRKEQAAHERTKAEVEQAREILSALEGETLVEAASDLAREHETTNEAYHAIHHRYWKEAVPGLAAAEAEVARLRTALSAAVDEAERANMRADAAGRQLREAREPLATYAHEAWAGWMRYLWSKATKNADGTLTLPEWAVIRWARQMATPYADLPELEKESDRAEADKMLLIVRADAAERKLTTDTTE